MSETTTYVGFYRMEGSADLPVWITADSYGDAERLLSAWRANRNPVADRILSPLPIRIERDEREYRTIRYTYDAGTERERQERQGAYADAAALDGKAI